MNSLKKWTMMIVTIVTIILIITIGISAGGRARTSTAENILNKVINPIQKTFYKVGSATGDFMESLVAFRKIKKENEQLRDEVNKLNKQLIEETLTKNELKELRKLHNVLNYIKPKNEYDYISASVISKGTGNWFNTFTIDAGRNEGVVKDSTLLNSEGLIGRVFEVGDSYSKVISIINNKSSVSYQVLRNNQYLGVVRGTVSESMTEGFEYMIGGVEPDVEILVGDKLITSGLSMYSKGILIGEVKEVIKNEDELLKTVKVKPAVNFKKIDKVFIILSQNTMEE
ncbi:MAG: rod shape-determining protein MreC [Anaeromicrobium sp.]|jgi:rod shape-determining protein MreC|uniref:rod shape-determining protein MreC n=1 Tax=Anaeromicrobium sp. TaxID=1929132 RepID=UPI0025E31CE1|nr:rod shape-determining protein MreC [Anaeromicrobium sp.]MCT4594946.1 rod shape-determining protein MreC [Anaeromicrobium sp.]